MDNIQGKLSENEKKLLLSFEEGEPEWGLFSIPNVKDLPAVRWKLQNIQKLKVSNPKKHALVISKFKKTMGV